MNSFEVIITVEAKEELKSIYHYITKNSANNALNWLNLMEEKIASLAQMPERCPIAPEDNFFDEKIRHLIVKRNYRVLFFVENTFVYILHVRHCSQLYQNQT